MAPAFVFLLQCAYGISVEPRPPKRIHPSPQAHSRCKEVSMRMSTGCFFVGLILLASSSALAICNNPPTANTDVYNMAKNTTLSIYDGTLKANDTDPNGDPLTSYISGYPSSGSWCGVAPDGYC